MRFGYFGMHGFGAVIKWFRIRFGVFLSSKKNKNTKIISKFLTLFTKLNFKYT